MAGKGPRYWKQKKSKGNCTYSLFLVGVFLFNLSVRIFHHVNVVTCSLKHKQVTPGDEPIPSHPPKKTGCVSAKKMLRSKKLNLQCPEALTSPMIAFQRCASGSSCAWYMWGNSANALIQAVESFWKPSKDVKVTKSSDCAAEECWARMLFRATKPPNWWGSSEIVINFWDLPIYEVVPTVGGRNPAPPGMQKTL